MEHLSFRFEPKWREELVCTCRLGSFSLEMTMGSATEVYLPTEEAWQTRAPEWAKPYWDQLHAQLVGWCGSRYPLFLSETAPIY